MTDAPTPREVLADALYKAVVQPELTWWDDLTPEMQEDWLRAADVALTRRGPLDVERLRRAHRAWCHPTAITCEHEGLHEMAAKSLAAEYERLGNE